MFFWLLLTVLLFITFLILLWYVWFKFSKICQSLNKLPGPTPLPLIGNIHQVLGGFDVALHVTQEKWVKEFGEIFRVYITPNTSAFFCSPELIEDIVNNPHLLDKGADYELLYPWLGLGLLTSSGAKWKSRRRLLTPAFHFNIMEDFFETFNEHSSIFCRKLDDICRHDKTEIDIQKLTSLCTLDIICETAMGCKVNAQTQESEYVRAVNHMATSLMQRSISPLSRFDFIYKFMKNGREYAKTLKTLLNFTEQVIEKRQSLMREETPNEERNNGKRRPFLELLLEASTSAKGTVLTRQDISDEVNTFMFEGHDTTAVALNWVLYCLASNPEHQERVYVELCDVFGDSDRPCTRQDLTELKYLECCIKETLRLYPSVPTIARVATEQVKIGEYEFPAGTDIVIAIYALHRNPRIYPNPLIYDPERFLPEQCIGRHPYAFIPFSAGPRNCIGQRFAMAEEKVVLSALLRKFKFELSPTAPVPKPSAELTLKSINGIHLIVSRRT